MSSIETKINIFYFEKIAIAITILLHVLIPCHAESKDILTPEERAWLSAHDGKIIIDQSNENWAPIEGIDNDGNPFGIAIDYYLLIEKKLNFKFKIDEPRPYKEKLKRFHSGEIDVVNSVQKTPERSEYALFTKPYIEIPNVIIVRKGVTRSLSPDQMSGMKISVAKGFAIHEYLKNKYGYLDLLPVPDDLTALLTVSSKRVDAVIMNLAVASHLIEKEGISNLRIAGKTEYVNALCLASGKDRPILNRILEKGLSQITPEERKAIYNKWIHLEPEPFYRNRMFQAIVIGMVGTSFLIIFLAFIWNRALKLEVEKKTKKLMETEERLKNIIEFLPDATFVVDRDKKVIAWNRSMEKMTGIRKEDIIGRSEYDYAIPFYGERRPILIDLIGKKDRQIESLYDHFERKNDVLYAETFLPGLDLGKGAYVRATASHLIDNEGNFVGAIESIQDITQRKQQENELRNHRNHLEEIVKTRTMELQESKERYRTIIDNSPMGIHQYRLEYDGRLIFESSNPTADELTGINNKEIIGKTIEEAFPSLAGTEIPDAYRLVASEGKYLKTEDVHYEDDCIRGAFEVNAFQSSPGRTTVMFSNITERKQSEEALIASQKELDSVVRTVPDIIYRLDTDGCITFISDSVKRYGYQPEELIGKYLLEIVHPDDREKATDKIKERRSGERSTKSFEIRLLTKKKDAVSFEIFSIYAEGLYASEKPDMHAFIGTQGIARDITDRKHAEEASLDRAKLQAVLETAGAACHELNQPLQAISGYSDLFLIAASEEDPHYGKIKKIRKQIDRMGKITAKLMGITRYETKVYSEKTKIIDLDNVKERRKYKRFIPSDQAYVSPKSDSSRQQQIIDISMGGIAFWCNEAQDQIEEFNELSINSNDMSFNLDKFQCNINSDSKRNIEIPHLNHEKMKRRSMQFGGLTRLQADQLEYFIQNHTSAKTG